MIAIRDLSVAIGGTPILSGVEFDAQAGAVTAIIGPNGSGKTTLLRALSGDIGYRGSVTINGFPVDRTPAWRMAAMRAVLPQATALSFPFTVREVVALGLMAGTAGGGSGLVAEALERVDLAGFAKRFYQELSGGEQQRVQLARVLCQVWEPSNDGAPRWLLLDEPVSSLDIRHQLVIMDIARAYAAAGGGVVAVLHDLNLTATYAETVAVMRAGRLAASGPTADMLDDGLLEDVFGCALRVGALPRANIPFVLPQAIAR